MEIFKNTNFDFLGKKWPFIIASLVLTVAGLTSIALKGGLRYGIDFKEGTQMTVKWNGNPPEDKIRAALSKRISGEVSVQPFADVASKNEVVIGTERMSEQQTNAARQAMQDTLEATFGDAKSGKLDFNNTGVNELVNRLTVPLQQAGVQLSDQQLRQLCGDLLNFRNTPPRSGLVTSFDQLSAVPGVNPAIINVLKQQCYLAPFSIREVAMVGPKVGAELRTKAVLATLYALGGMLVYIAFRFEWIYGVAAVVAVFHDTIITIGLFSIFNKEITLTVIAALLTLVGYSMNDTIVIFDRIRENLKILRREPLESLINKSVNQTLSRTIMTSGLTFLTVIALFLFGGPVLHGFSFALVVGIIVGTYSSVFIASPIVLFWHDYADSRKRTAPVMAAPKAQPVRKSSTKVVK
jgi:preprotein translocase subunit SecF